MRVAVKGAKCKSDVGCSLEAVTPDGFCQIHIGPPPPDFAGLIRVATPLEQENCRLIDEVHALKIERANYSRWLDDAEEENVILMRKNEALEHNAFHFENNFRVAQKLIAELNARVKEMEGEIESLRNAILK